MLLVLISSYYRLAPADTVPFSTSTSDVGLFDKFSHPQRKPELILLIGRTAYKPWQEQCEQASKEQDPKKLMKLIAETN
jgi:hypothetical protein